jgi:hypothetical protein
LFSLKTNYKNISGRDSGQLTLTLRAPAAPSSSNKKS